MASADQYAQWIVDNAAKKGTPEFDTVAKAYQEAVAEEKSLPPVEVYANEGMPAERTVGEFLGNVGTSGAKVVGGLVQAVAHPIDTAKGVLDLGAGALQNALPKALVDFVNKSETPEALAAGQKAIEVANAVGGEYKQKYGSIDALTNTLYTDPVGAAADLSLLFTGGGGALRAGANVAEKAGVSAAALNAPRAVASAVQKGGNLIDPARPVIYGASLPFRLGAKGVGAVNNMLSPKTAALIAASEGKGQDIVNALRNYDDMVAGVRPTAGTVVAGQMPATKYAALQRDLAEQASTPYYERGQANVAARGEALGTIAQDEAALKAAEAARTKVSKPLYEAADAGVADVSKVASTLDDLIAKNPGNRDLIRELKEIRTDLVDETTGGLRTNAKEVTSIIDGIKMRLAKEDSKFIKGELRDIRELLVDSVPGYRAAQEAFAKASKPVNIMQVGQYLEGKLKPAMETSIGERPGVFSAAVKEAPTTIKRSTGQSRFDKLDQILEPEQVKIVEGIRKDLAREAEFAKQATEGGKSGRTFPAPPASLPNFMSRVTAVANVILTRLQGKINQKLAIEMATEMLDPKAAAVAMEKALAREAKGQKLADPFKTVGGAAYAGARSPMTLGGVQINNALVQGNQNNLRND
jgi:hypothetical protein